MLGLELLEPPDFAELEPPPELPPEPHAAVINPAAQSTAPTLITRPTFDIRMTVLLYGAADEG